MNTTTQIHRPVVIDNIVFSSAPVPEPSTVVWTIGGLVALSFVRSKRGRKR